MTKDEIIESQRANLAEFNQRENSMLSVIADIRIKSGVGMKPMLSELADAIAAKIGEFYDLSSMQANKIDGLLEDIGNAIMEKEQAADTITTLRATIARLEGEKADLERHVEELREKLAAPVCGCSYDYPGDVCMAHSPLLKKALAEKEALEGKKAKLMEGLAVIADGDGDAQEIARQTLEETQ